MDLMSSIQHSLEIAGKLRDLSKKVQDAEFRMLLADLVEQLADAKLEAAGLKEQLAEVKKSNLEKDEQLNRRALAEPNFEDDSYVFPGESGNFCTGCWDSKRAKIRLSLESGPFSTFGKWSCPVCLQHFGR